MRDHQLGGSSVHGNLPLELNAFVGRSAELAGLAGVLGAARPVTVTGAGGVGKSRLAARAAVRCAPRDGVMGVPRARAKSRVWGRVELAPVRDPEFADHAIVEALGLPDHTMRLPRETLLAHLAERQLLLVLDGFEHLVEACAGLVGELLGQLPGLRVLAVGRRPLGVAGERVFPLAALAALHECREEAERSADATAVAYAEHRTGCLALVTDDMARAETLLCSALERYREIGELNSDVLMGQVEPAMARAFQGDLPDAVRLCEDVRRVCEDHGERWTRTYALYVLAYAAWADGDPAGARTLLTDCLAGVHSFHDLLGSVPAVELLALVTAVQGDAAEAAVLHGAAARMWPSVGLPLFGSVYYNAPRELCEGTARERLGDERYEECVAEGARLMREAAVSRALEQPTCTNPPPPAPTRAGRRRAEVVLPPAGDQRA